MSHPNDLRKGKEGREMAKIIKDQISKTNIHTHILTYIPIREVCPRGQRKERYSTALHVETMGLANQKIILALS